MGSIRDRLSTRLAGMTRAAAAGALALSGTSACSSSSTLGFRALDAEAACPITLAAASGAACDVPGLTCYPSYACGLTDAIGTCVCERGHFACHDVTSAPVDPGGAPRCPASSKATSTCPTTEKEANLGPCALSGLICPYPAPCSGATPAFDTCECRAGQQSTGTLGLRFECMSACDAPTDAGLVGADAGARDASVTDAGSTDAATTDAAPDGAI